MTKGLVVKKSRINKRGFFAARNFRKGEVVLRWHPKILTKAAVDKLPLSRKHDVDQVGKNRYVLQNPAERFMNHSCEPNTRVRNQTDVAIRDIKKGEEITSDYGKGLILVFKCDCGSKKCRGIIKWLLYFNSGKGLITVEFSAIFDIFRYRRESPDTLKQRFWTLKR